MIEAVLVDFDGVLRIWSSENDARAEKAAGLPTGAILRAAFSPELLHPAITGRISDDEWRQQVAGRLCQDYPDSEADRAVRLWAESPGEVNHEVLGVLRECRRAANLVLVTNATTRLPDDLQRLGLAGEFDHVINSSEVGWVKPQPQIYEAALSAAGVSASAALFVDDTPSHVAAAAELGLKSYRFSTVTNLRRDLCRCGLLAG